MPKAKEGDTVVVHYTGKLADGCIFDTSRNADPLRFTMGEGRMIPGFEEAIIGMSPGESKTVEMPPEKAYGKYREDLLLTIKRSDLPEDIVPELGMDLEICAVNGRMVPVQITDMDEEVVCLDANHPLAEQTLTFDIALVEIVEGHS
jgi:FKBP-type peptidyl-prolyl cis-trans isomerase 2